MGSNRKIRAELIACSVSFLLAVAKSFFALWTGALALFASALDSLMDSFVSGINLFSLKVAERPADEDHAFGHGKAEAIAALLQSVVIFASAVYLLVTCVRRFWQEVPVLHLEGGIGVVAVSIAFSLYLARLLKKTAAETGSVILKTDTLHYAMDVYTQGGILASFFLIRITGWNILDLIVTVPIAAYIVYVSVGLGRQSIDELMDREVSPEVRKKVEEIVAAHRPEVIGMHNFKSRRSGSKRFLQFHLEMRRNLPFEKVHQLEERIAGEIRREMGDVQLIIHADPEGMGLDQTDLM